MSIFLRSFKKTIPTQHFTKPNNYLLFHNCPPIYLCTSTQPSIEHLNSVKSLFKTIKRLQGHTSNTTYQKLVNTELQNLKKQSKRYAQTCVKFVENGGRLSAAGLANLYACAQELKVNPKWLELYAQGQIPHLIKNMNKQNLVDVQNGLKKNNVNNDFLGLVQKQIQSRGKEQYQYVTRAINEAHVYQQYGTLHSNNRLINAIEGKQNVLIYHFNKLLDFQYDVIGSIFKLNPKRYALD